MSLINILQFPDPRLKKIAAPVTVFDEALAKLIADLFETMHEAYGVGLAATQVNIHQRIIVVDVSDDQKQPLCLINPEITQKHGSVLSEEGCLSFPGVYAKVQRAKDIVVNFVDQKGHAQHLKASGLLSICIQHETDHLNGVTFYDHLSPLKQELLNKKLEKNRKRTL